MKAILFGAVLALSGALHADERLFSFSYGAEVLPKGGMEYEQWITNYNGHASGVFSRYAIDEEIEYGILDKLSASLYIHFNQDYESILDPSTGLVSTDSEFRFDGFSTEWKYLVLSPEKDPFGLLLYFEPRYSGEELELEGKIVLQKNLGERWVSVANIVVEQEYAYAADTTEIKGEPKISLGLAYKITPTFSLGLEAKNDMIWPDNWGYEAASAWYLGPAVHVTAEKWWLTLALVAQVHGQPETIPGDGRLIDNGNEDFSRVQARLGTGVNF